MTLFRPLFLAVSLLFAIACNSDRLTDPTPIGNTVPGLLKSVSTEPIAQVSAGIYHTCAVKTDGTVVCWGWNNSGQATVPAGLNLNVTAVQSITIISRPPSPALIGGTYTVSATGGGSGNPVIFSSATSSMCSVAGNQVSAPAAGICVVAANQAGSLGYFAAPEVTRTFSIVAVPTSKDSCKDDGWKSVARANGSTFKNQGDCVQYFNAKK